MQWRHLRAGLRLMKSIGGCFIHFCGVMKAYEMPEVFCDNLFNLHYAILPYINKRTDMI